MDPPERKRIGRYFGLEINVFKTAHHSISPENRTGSLLSFSSSSSSSSKRLSDKRIQSILCGEIIKEIWGDQNPGRLEIFPVLKPLIQTVKTQFGLVRPTESQDDLLSKAYDWAYEYIGKDAMKDMIFLQYQHLRFRKHNQPRTFGNKNENYNTKNT